MSRASKRHPSLNCALQQFGEGTGVGLVSGPTKLDSPVRVIENKECRDGRTEALHRRVQGSSGIGAVEREKRTDASQSGLWDQRYHFESWKQEFQERAPQLFKGEKTEDHQAEMRIAELERMVGKLTLELDTAKKVLGYSNWIGKTSGE